MATHLYCVLAPARSEALPAGLTGVGGAPVRSLSFGASGGMEAWVSTVDDEMPRATGAALATEALVHNEVVNAALGTGRTPAPARYGSNFSDDAACITDLHRRSELLARILEQIADCVEMSVLLVPTRGTRKIEASRPALTEPAAGRRYLESVRQRAYEQQERHALADAEAERLVAVVGRYVRCEVRSIAGTGVMSVAHLVRNADVTLYRNALADFVPDQRFRIVMGEPRAPYSFTDSRLDRTGHDSGNHA